MKVESGACTIDLTQMPNWFGDSDLHQPNADFDQPWRIKILDDLKKRLPLKHTFSDFELAVNTTSWLHTAEARVHFNSSGYHECILQLEWIENNGTLTILNPDGATTMVSTI